jgi:hypothetical protein
MNPFSSLLRSRKFWVAVMAAASTILFQFFPNFPDSVWQSINVLAGVVIAAIAYEDGNKPASPNG